MLFDRDRSKNVRGDARSRKCRAMKRRADEGSPRAKQSKADLIAPLAGLKVPISCESEGKTIVSK
jgi:hypothetical protein